jgi:hypothetical protein
MVILKNTRNRLNQGTTMKAIPLPAIIRKVFQINLQEICLRMRMIDCGITI